MQGRSGWGQEKAEQRGSWEREAQLGTQVEYKFSSPTLGCTTLGKALLTLSLSLLLHKMGALLASNGSASAEDLALRSGRAGRRTLTARCLPVLGVPGTPGCHTPECRCQRR